MVARSRRAAVGAALALSILGAGCSSPLDFLNPTLLSALGAGQRVASLPGDAPGLLVAVRNGTDRWVDMVVSYRDIDDNVVNYTTVVKSGDKTAQMLICPVKELTLGDVANLGTPGVKVYLVSGATGAAGLANAPFLEVDPFGTLLRVGVNYDCGDEVLFTVEPSGAARSGYQTRAEIRRSGAVTP